MFKPVCAASAAVLLLAGLGLESAQAQPRPRFSTRLPAPPAAAPVQPAVARTPAPTTVVETSEPEFETPRPAPLGAVAATELPTLAPAAEQPTPVPFTPAQPAPFVPTQAPVQPAPAAASSAPPAISEISHTVAAGDTIYAVGRRYGVGPQTIATLNGLTFSSTLRVGQRLALPAGAVDSGPAAAFPGVRRPAAPAVPAPVDLTPPPVVAATVAVEAPQSSPALTPAPEPAPPVASPPAPQPRPAPPVFTPRPAPPPAAPVAAPSPRPLPPVAATPAPNASVAPQTPPPAAAVKPNFSWPVRGEIMAPFGPTGVGQRNDGLRIAAAEGASVRAAAPGRVVYAGDQVKGGYGKLVLVEHEGRWFTAYAHLSDIKVRMRDTVQAGQELGSVGRTGSVAAPQLYFEVRHAPDPNDRARPVDPMPLLPQ